MQSFLSAMYTSTREILLSALRNLLKGPSLLQTVFAVWLSPLIPRRIQQDKAIIRLLEEYVVEVEHLLSASTDPESLLNLSSGFQRQLNEALICNPKCMLPSYNHQLPNGKERGRFLALDLGGSTFRIALIDLQGEGDDTARIVRKKSWKVDQVARKLEGKEFFDWMASKIQEVLDLESENQDSASLAMGLSWSFPIECVTLLRLWFLSTYMNLQANFFT